MSLEVFITILAILGAVWRLETRIADTRQELKGDIQRLETKIDAVDQRLGEKIDAVQQRLGTRIERVDDKVDEGNQQIT